MTAIGFAIKPISINFNIPVDASGKNLALDEINAYNLVASPPALRIPANMQTIMVRVEYVGGDMDLLAISPRVYGEDSNLANEYKDLLTNRNDHPKLQHSLLDLIAKSREGAAKIDPPYMDGKRPVRAIALRFYEGRSTL